MTTDLIEEAQYIRVRVYDAIGRFLKKDGRSLRLDDIVLRPCTMTEGEPGLVFEWSNGDDVLPSTRRSSYVLTSGTTRMGDGYALGHRIAIDLIRQDDASARLPPGEKAKRIQRMARR